jgi:hypothetical protein
MEEVLVADNSLQDQQKRGMPRGRPFEKGCSGNPAGRPYGLRNRATQMAEALLDGEAEALTRKAVGLALDGDRAALRLCLERVVPRREREALVALPPIREVAHLPAAMAAIAAAVAEGALTAGEAEALGRLVETFVRVFEAGDIDVRLKGVEAMLGARL